MHQLRKRSFLFVIYEKNKGNPYTNFIEKADKNVYSGEQVTQNALKKRG